MEFNKETKFNDEPINVSKQMEQAGLVYREPPPEESMSPVLKEKFKIAREIWRQ